ncbi:TspO/MBR family protein [Nocardia sp. NPDC006044]|uniref:TspO/MBR family protein n=1 Tax=Nocardia sp. NPDC006044 TaxID=3364306 RepID=UPI00369D0D12
MNTSAAQPVTRGWPSRRNLIETGTEVVAAAVAGSLATGPGSRWYQRLDKPGFQPPGAVFPIAWTLLYGDVAVTTARALDRADRLDARALRRALAVNLALNAGWSWMFFRAHRLRAATALSAALTVSSADLARRVIAEDRAGWALSAYPLWCGFATALSASLWRRNR